MKVVILCGGEGTRLSEYTDKIPKSLIEIGGKPILWHIMRIFRWKPKLRSISGSKKS